MYCLFEKTENKQKRGRDWPIFFKKWMFSSLKNTSDGESNARESDDADDGQCD